MHRLKNMEKENKGLATEVNSLKQQVERIKGEKDENAEELAHTQALLLSEHNQLLVLKDSKEREEEEWRKEKMVKTQLIQEKTGEVHNLICS